MENHVGDLCRALRAKPVDSIASDDVLAVLKPIWTEKGETASRVRGRIEKVLDAETALAHVIGDKAEQAYYRSDALEKRRSLMEAWAAYCEKPAGNVVPIGKRKSR
jgi:hypothetical protein